MFIASNKSINLTYNKIIKPLSAVSRYIS